MISLRYQLTLQNINLRAEGRVRVPWQVFLYGDAPKPGGLKHRGSDVINPEIQMPPTVLGINPNSINF